jgi:hypothetical protein
LYSRTTAQTSSWRGCGLLEKTRAASASEGRAGVGRRRHWVVGSRGGEGGKSNNDRLQVVGQREPLAGEAVTGRV